VGELWEICGHGQPPGRHAAQPDPISRRSV
jgi:hypothetical protein